MMTSHTSQCSYPEKPKEGIYRTLKPNKTQHMALSAQQLNLLSVTDGMSHNLSNLERWASIKTYT